MEFVSVFSGYGGNEIFEMVNIYECMSFKLF